MVLLCRRAGVDAAKGTTKNLLTQIIEGGWVMFPIAACSVLTVYLIGEGVTRTNPLKLAPPAQAEALRNLFRAGDYVGAYGYAKAQPSPLTNVVRIGVSYLGDGQAMTETAMSEELAKENAHLQTKLSYLSVIGVCTPMIGLLGTVTGMMSAFSTLGTSGIGDSGGSGSDGGGDCAGDERVRQRGDRGRVVFDGQQGVDRQAGRQRPKRESSSDDATQANQRQR